MKLLTKLKRNVRRFAVHCKTQDAIQQRTHAARAHRKRVLDALQRTEAMDAIRDGCR